MLASYSNSFVLTTLDASFVKDGGCVPVTRSGNSSVPLIYSPTGPLDRDVDDVRRFSEAAEDGIKRYIYIYMSIYINTAQCLVTSTRGKWKIMIIGNDFERFGLRKNIGSRRVAWIRDGSELFTKHL